MRRTVLEPGELVAGKYQVKELLGRGGMGQVYLARHTITGKRVALKVLSGGASPTAHADKRLVREAVATGCIEHRHVVNVFDIGEHNNALFLVMEYLEGKSFKQVMNERKTSDREIVEIMLRAMEGVRAAHAQGVVHRDLKPDNILVCMGPSGHYDDPKVVDFGICRLSAESGLTDLTQVGVTLGSPFYMSLEQLQGARDLDGRADLYSIGVILYQALTLRRPFEATTLGELTSKIASGPSPVPLAELRPDLPRGLSRVVMRALSRTRDRRQPDVATLIRELTPFVSQLSDTAPSGSSRPLLVSATRAAHTPFPRWNAERARPWLQLGAAALAAFVLTLVGISLVRSLQKPEDLAGQPVQLQQSTRPAANAQAIEPEVSAPTAAAPNPVELSPEPPLAPEPIAAKAERSPAPRRGQRPRRLAVAKPATVIEAPAAVQPQPVVDVQPAPARARPPIDLYDPYR